MNLPPAFLLSFSIITLGLLLLASRRFRRLGRQRHAWQTGAPLVAIVQLVDAAYRPVGEAHGFTVSTARWFWTRWKPWLLRRFRTAVPGRRALVHRHYFRRLVRATQFLLAAVDDVEEVVVDQVDLAHSKRCCVRTLFDLLPMRSVVDVEQKYN